VPPALPAPLAALYYPVVRTQLQQIQEPPPDAGTNPDAPVSSTPTIPVTSTRTYFITEGFITQPDSKQVYFRGFSQSELELEVPAQPFIVQQGDTVNVTINNTLTTDHSFVIDGVVDIMQGRAEQLALTLTQLVPTCFMIISTRPIIGLYAGSPSFKQQYFWLINDIDPVWHNDIKNGITPSTPFVPFYFTINGLSMRVPGHPDYKNASIDAGYNPQTRIVGSIGDRALIRTLHAGMCTHSMHWHANHVEWLTRNGQILDSIWEKDTILLPRDKGKIDVIYPFSAPPNALPAVTTGHFPMHFHDEMTQTAGGGLYQFGIATTIEFK